MPLFIDTRMIGQHGIGRYADEVTRGMTLPWSPIGLRSDLYALADPLRRRHVPRGATIYSPGYRAGAWESPQYLTLHDLIHIQTHPHSKYRAYYELLLKPKIRQAGMVFTVSNTSRTAIRRWLRDDSVRIVVTGNGCSTEFHDAGPAYAASRPYVVFVGNLKPHKNFFTLLHAIALSPDIDLVAVTDDPVRTLSAADAVGIGGRVRALSGLSDTELSRYYRGARATVFPSLHEGFGLPAVESLACGTPVIYLRTCESVAEIVGDQGIAVDAPTDPVHWSRAIGAAAETVISVDTASLRERYSWDAVVRSVEAGLLST